MDPTRPVHFLSASSATDDFEQCVEEQQSEDISDIFQRLVIHMQKQGLKTGLSEDTFEHNAKVFFNNGQFAQADGCFQSAYNFSEDENKKIYYLFMRGLCYCKFRNSQGDQDAIDVFHQITNLQSTKSKWVQMANGFRILIENRNKNVSRMFQDVSNPRMAVGKTIAPEYWGSQLTDSQRDEAITSFQAVVDNDPNTAMGWEYLAILKMGLDNISAMEETVEALKNLVRIIPQHEKGWEFLAVCLVKLDMKKNGEHKDYIEETFEASKKALELNPENDRAFHYYQRITELHEAWRPSSI